MLAYFNGSDRFSSDFELDGMQIAEDVHRSRLYTPLNRVPGHVITSIKLNDDIDLDLVEILLNQKATLVEDDITIVAS